MSLLIFGGHSRVLIYIPQRIRPQLRWGPTQGIVVPLDDPDLFHKRFQGSFGDVPLIFEGSFVIVADGDSNEVF